MKSIILAYDGSDPAKRALERTAELANGANVTVVSAVHGASRRRAGGGCISTRTKSRRVSRS